MQRNIYNYKCLDIQGRDFTEIEHQFNTLSEEGWYFICYSDYSYNGLIYTFKGCIFKKLN